MIRYRLRKTKYTVLLVQYRKPREPLLPLEKLLEKRKVLRRTRVSVRMADVSFAATAGDVSRGLKGANTSDGAPD